MVSSPNSNSLRTSSGRFARFIRRLLCVCVRVRTFLPRFRFYYRSAGHESCAISIRRFFGRDTFCLAAGRSMAASTRDREVAIANFIVLLSATSRVAANFSSRQVQIGSLFLSSSRSSSSSSSRRSSRRRGLRRGRGRGGRLGRRFASSAESRRVERGRPVSGPLT